MYATQVQRIPSQSLFGLNIMAVGFDRAVALLSHASAATDRPARVVVTPNVDHVVQLDRQPALRASYRKADFIFPDGVPIVWASRLLGRPLPERVTGADLMVALCRMAAEQGWEVAIVGGKPGNDVRILTTLQQVYPGIRARVFTPSMHFDPQGEEGDDIARAVQAGAPRLTFVCLGLAKQEIWALRHAPEFSGGAILCVGAALDFALGIRRRAPRWFQQLGMEWLWRLMSNPRRLWRRYLVEDPYFLLLCLREWRSVRAQRKASIESPDAHSG